MGYLICDKCGGYYELQPGEKPEDFSNECECGGELFYSDILEFTPEVESESDIQTESDIHDSDIESDIPNEPEISEDTSSYEEESLIMDNTTIIEDDKAALRTKSKRKELKLATELQEILETKGYFMIKANGHGKSIKILPEGIETNEGQLIKFENINSVEDIDEARVKEDLSPKKSGISALVGTAQEILASRKGTIRIVFDTGEIELKDVKKNDAKRFVSFANRMLNRVTQ